MNRLKELRLEKGLTQEKLANKLGINRTTIAKIESGDRDLTLDHIQRMSAFFGVPYDYLLGKTNNRTNTIQVIDMTNSKDGVTPIQMEVLKKIDDLNVKDLEQIMDYIDFIKSKGANKK
jgi:transcriptional regulator with XRE-family HTH domain